MRRCAVQGGECAAGAAAELRVALRAGAAAARVGPAADRRDAQLPLRRGSLPRCAPCPPLSAALWLPLLQHWAGVIDLGLTWKRACPTTIVVQYGTEKGRHTVLTHVSEVLYYEIAESEGGNRHISPERLLTR